MKTLKEFIQRLQDDAAFEERAHAFVTDDELMAFVKSEGYDFTLEELTDELQPVAATRPAAVDLTPATDEEAATKAVEFAGGREALSRSESRDFTKEDPSRGLPKPQGEPKERSLGELFRLGGGRHRGFSPQRLKSVTGEEPRAGGDDWTPPGGSGWREALENFWPRRPATQAGWLPTASAAGAGTGSRKVFRACSTFSRSTWVS